MKTGTGNILIGLITLLIIIGSVFTLLATFHIGATTIELIYVGLGLFAWAFAGLITYEGLYAQKNWENEYNEVLVIILVYVGYGALYLMGGIYLAKYLWGF